jgi:hypothetical protein
MSTTSTPSSGTGPGGNLVADSSAGPQVAFAFYPLNAWMHLVASQRLSSTRRTGSPIAPAKPWLPARIAIWLGHRRNFVQGITLQQEEG